MRVLMLDADEAMLEERARRGADRWDEMWEGVLHMVPSPLPRHQRLVLGIGRALFDHAEANGMWVTHELNFDEAGCTDNYRIPDIAIYTDDDLGHRGLLSAPTVFEIHSAGDEAYEKLDFYFANGTDEVVIIHRDTLAVEVFRPDPDGRAMPTGDTSIHSLDATFTKVDDDTLRVTWPTGTFDVRL